MIIRRRHTANFTTIGNSLFDDRRLALDEIGLMSWLLSRPDDWEVRRPALMRQFKIGRDGLRRILRALIRFGWIRAEVTRSDTTGRVYVTYEVRDDPGPELSEDEARAALSLVSSGAGPGELSDDDGERDGTEETGETSIAPDADPGGGSPPTGQPVAASRLRLSPPGSIEDSLKTDSVKTESTKDVRAFADVLAKWDRDHVLSPSACEASFLGMTEATREKAFRGIDPYLSDCRKTARKVCDLATYLRERRWERFEVKSDTAKPFHLRRGMPQAYRWREYYERAEPSKLRMFDLMLDRNGYTAPSEWPPPLPPKEDVSLISTNDAKALAGEQ